MILMVLLSVVLGGVLVWALYAEPAPPRPQPVTQPLGTWSTGADLRRHGFPIVLAGYDPEAVDAHLARIAVVHDELRQRAPETSHDPADPADARPPGDPAGAPPGDPADATPAGDPSDPRGPAGEAPPPPVPGDPPPPPVPDEG